MRILILDSFGASLDWAQRCMEDGHKVKVFIPRKPRYECIGDGYLDKVDEWQRWVVWADMVFLTDNTRYLSELERWRNKGPVIIGPNDETTRWELDRDYGAAKFRSKGIDVSPSKRFAHYDDAIRHVKKTMQAYACKPCGDEEDKSLSYVGKTAEDMIYMLEKWKRQKRHKGAFILQEKVDGCEMAVGGWFGPGGFNAGWCENWEFKKLMPGDLGPNTGEQGTIVRYVHKSKLAEKVLLPFAGDLAKAGYCGYIDVNCIIDDTGKPWPLEFTMRPGWPTFNIQQVLVKGDRAQWLADLAGGRDAKAVVMDTVAAGVVVSIPDYPFNKMTPETSRGLPIYGIKPSMRPYVHLSEAMLGSAPQDVNGAILDLPMPVTAGTYVLVASGAGETVEEARRHAYQIVSRISLPGSPMWRTDIGMRLRSQIPKLQALGYATGMTYKAMPLAS